MTVYRSLCFKDFRWASTESAQPVDVPAGQGIVPWEKFLKLLSGLRIDVPMSVHCEWPLFDATEASLPISQRRALAVPRLRRDGERLVWESMGQYVDDIRLEVVPAAIPRPSGKAGVNTVGNGRAGKY